MTIACLLALCALIAAIASALSQKVPLWVAVVLMGIVQLLQCFPLR